MGCTREWQKQGLKRVFLEKCYCFGFLFSTWISHIYGYSRPDAGQAQRNSAAIATQADSASPGNQCVTCSSCESRGLLSV